MIDPIVREKTVPSTRCEYQENNYTASVKEANVQLNQYGVAQFCEVTDLGGVPKNGVLPVVGLSDPKNRVEVSSTSRILPGGGVSTEKNGVTKEPNPNDSTLNAKYLYQDGKAMSEVLQF